MVAFMAAVILAACSGDNGDLPVGPLPTPNQPSEPEQPTAVEREMGFTCNFAEPTTKAVGDGEYSDASDNAMLKACGFGVFCWYTGSNSFDPAFNAPNTHIKDYLGATGSMLMNNQKVEWDGTGSKWTYTPKKYWPINQEELLTLRAYAPYTSYVMTDVHGMPQLPIVVDKDDYHNGTQHDPLWGTGRLVLPSGEYDVGTTYGNLYDNITYQMSGTYRLANAGETRNGTIDWFFHHGMSCLMFTCSVIADPGCDKVTIKSIEIGNLYTRGLLSLSSPTASESEKPIWDERAGDMRVRLSNAEDSTDLEHKQFEINTKLTPPRETDPVNLLGHGLLIIPRNHVSDPGLKVTVTYTIDTDSDPLIAVGTIKRNFEGNTKYTLGLKLTPSTGGLDIEVVQSAFTPWIDGGSGIRDVYNW
jgi:hypothetical protein